MLNGGPISWYSKKQATVALSSTKAEYIAFTLAAKEATWFCLLFTELGILETNNNTLRLKSPIRTCACRPSTAISISSTPTMQTLPFHSRVTIKDLLHWPIIQSSTPGPSTLISSITTFVTK